MSQSTATNGQSGSVFRAASLGPEELERFASLFVPVWDLPRDDVAAGPDPGFKSAPLGAMLAADLIPRSSRSTPPPGAVVDDERNKIALAKTMAAIAPAPALPSAPSAQNDVMVKPSAPVAAATPAAFAKPRIESVAADLDALPASGKSKTPLILGGLALVAAVAIGIFVTRGGNDAGADAKATAAEVKAESPAKKEEATQLPDPAKVADTATAAATTAAPPATAKAPEPEKTAEPVKAEPAKTAEPVKTAAPPKPPPVVAKPPAPPPAYTAKPPATTTPAPKPTATATTAKPKMKEDF